MSECPPDAITYCCQQDRFGAQLQRLIAAYSLASTINATFCVSPFSTGVNFPWLTHGWTREAADELLTFVGGHAYGPAATTSTRSVKNPTVLLLRQRYPALEVCKWRAEVRAAYYRETWSKPPLWWYEDSSRTHIAVHLRRGDVLATLEQRGLAPAGEEAAGASAAGETAANTAVAAAVELRRLGARRAFHGRNDGRLNDQRSQWSSAEAVPGGAALTRSTSLARLSSAQAVQLSSAQPGHCQLAAQSSRALRLPNEADTDCRRFAAGAWLRAARRGSRGCGSFIGRQQRSDDVDRAHLQRGHAPRAREWPQIAAHCRC